MLELRLTQNEHEDLNAQERKDKAEQQSWSEVEGRMQLSLQPRERLSGHSTNRSHIYPLRAVLGICLQQDLQLLQLEFCAPCVCVRVVHGDPGGESEISLERTDASSARWSPLMSPAASV